MYQQRQQTTAYPTYPWSSTTPYPQTHQTIANERIRREQEEFWTAVAGVVVAGAVIIGFGALVASVFR